MSGMLKQRSFFFILQLACVLCSAYSHASDSITWMEVDFPPGYFHEGDFKGQGYEDVITSILRENLPEYTHDIIMANLARMMHKFKQGEKVCNVALFKTPARAEHMYFSIPSTFTLPNGLITTRKKQALFGNSKPLELDVVLKGEIKLGISIGRSYGKPIDDVLEKHKDGGNVYVHSGDNVFESLLKMLLKDRVDCILGLPEEVMYVAEKKGVKKEIVSFGLKENEGTYDAWLGHVACSKTEWGKTLTEKINAIIFKERPSERYRGAYERWLDENSIENYRKLYGEVFLKTVK